MRNLCDVMSPLPLAGMVMKVGVVLRAVLASLSVRRKGRIAACGQYTVQRLQVVHFVESQIGMSVAMPRFSYFVVPMGTMPAAEKRETGRSLPSREREGSMTWVTNSLASI